MSRELPDGYWVNAHGQIMNSDDEVDPIENMDDDDRETEYAKMEEYGDDYMPPTH